MMDAFLWIHSHENEINKIEINLINLNEMNPNCQVKFSNVTEVMHYNKVRFKYIINLKKRSITSNPTSLYNSEIR